jgi:hypothetical protein
MLRQDIVERLLKATQEKEHRFRCLSLCEVVDEFCPPSLERKGVGRPVTFSDNMVIKMDLLGRLSGIKGETELLRHLERHYDWLFPLLPSQSWLWRRLQQVTAKIERFRRRLRHELGVGLEDTRILDTFPLPVFKTWRPGRGNGFDLADWGRCSSKKLTYFGFKLMLSITPDGVPDVYDLCSARPHDVNSLEELVEWLRNGLVLGDKGFISQEKQVRLLENQGVYLLTYKKSNQKKQNTPLEQWFLGQCRQRIETVGSQLVDLLHVEDLGAKTDLGLAKRLIGAMTAFTLGIYMNCLLGRKPLAVKALFA